MDEMCLHVYKKFCFEVLWEHQFLHEHSPFVLQAFTEKQLSELDNEQIDSLSESQINDLPAPKASAIRAVKDEDPKDDDPYSTSGGK